MPLTEKGKKIMTHMKEQYGSKKGKEVFYASQNKGTVTGTHKTGEANSSAWLTGFVKGANALGVSEAADVQQLLKIAQRLHMMNTNGEAFEKGFDGIVKSAGPWGSALKGLLSAMWGSKKGLMGAGAAAGAGMMAPGIARRAGWRPDDASAWTLGEARQHADKAKTLNSLQRDNIRMPGAYEGPRPGYWSESGGYYTR